MHRQDQLHQLTGADHTRARECIQTWPVCCETCQCTEAYCQQPHSICRDQMLPMSVALRCTTCTASTASWSDMTSQRPSLASTANVSPSCNCHWVTSGSHSTSLHHARPTLKLKRQMHQERWLKLHCQHHTRSFKDASV